jgi:hypothetical protein
MIVTFEMVDESLAEEGDVTKTTFYGVQKVDLFPENGTIGLLLQSGWYYEHYVEAGWTYHMIDEEIDQEMIAVTADGNPRGIFRGVK